MFMMFWPGRVNGAMSSSFIANLADNIRENVRRFWMIGPILVSLITESYKGSTLTQSEKEKSTMGFSNCVHNLTNNLV
jgi:hypothetical protein